MYQVEIQGFTSLCCCYYLFEKKKLQTMENSKMPVFHFIIFVVSFGPSHNGSVPNRFNSAEMYLEGLVHIHIILMSSIMIHMIT